MKRELKNMAIILNIGSILLFLAGIGTILTVEIDPIIRLICSLTIGVFSFFFSFFTSKVLRIDSSSKLLHYLSIILIVIAYIYGGFNGLYGLFNVSSSMSKVFLASIYFLISILSVLTVLRYKNYAFLHLTFIALVLALYHLFNHFSFNYQIVFMIIGIVSLLFTIFKNEKIKNFAITFSYIYVFLCIILGYNDNLYSSMILFGINMLVIYNALYKDKNIICELITLLFIIVSVVIFGRVVSLHFDLMIASALIAFVIGILELLVNYYKVVDGAVNKILYKIGFILMYMVLSILTLKGNTSTLLPISIFMLLSSVGSSYLLKSDKDYFLGIKIIVFVIALLLCIDEYLINISELVYVYMVGISAILMYMLSKNNTFKTTSIIVSFAVLLPLIIMTKSTNVVFYLATCLYVLLNVLIYLYYDNFIDDALKTGLHTVCCYVLFAITMSSGLIINYLISSVMLLILLIINVREKTRYFVSLLFLYFVIKGLINTIFMNYNDVENISIILNSTLFFVTVLLFSLNCFENKGTKTNVITVTFGLGLLLLVSQYKGWLIILYSLLISLIMLVVGVINKEYKSSYIVGIVLTITCLIRLLTYLKGLPVVVYLVILGIVLITTISIMIIRYNKNPKKEEPQIEKHEQKPPKIIEYKYNYCEFCGNKVSETDDYCGECGNSLKGTKNYCNQCGRKILKGERFCESCGKRIK